LPHVLPTNVRLIVSTLPGRTLDALRRRAWPSFTLEPLNSEDRQQLITEYLSQYAKALSPRRAGRLIAAQQTANPLYLRSLLEELRVFGTPAQLDQKLGY